MGYILLRKTIFAIKSMEVFEIHRTQKRIALKITNRPRSRFFTCSMCLQLWIATTALAIVSIKCKEY